MNGTAEDYLWDDGLLAVKGSTNHYYANDELGSPMRLISEAGSISAAAGYDEFGRMSSGAEAMLELQPFGFTGYRADTVAGTYYAQAREYMPEYGRFAAEDRLMGNLWMPLSCNRYVYCWDNPKKYIDLDGNFPDLVSIITVGHYNRNHIFQGKYENLTPAQEKKLIKEITSESNGWVAAETKDNVFHQYTHGKYGEAAKNNTKYTKRTWWGGSYEIVIGKDKNGNQIIVDDPLNAGTFNLFDPILQKGEKKDFWYYTRRTLHGIFDVGPYVLLGNTGVMNAPWISEPIKAFTKNEEVCLR